MIAKPFDSSNKPSDARQAAGWEAEKQMAFYLHRAFAARPDVQVFNGLKCKVHGASAVSEKDCFQIDHLVIHSGGFVIVESKSAQGDMSVFADGQWKRGDEAIKSPIQQAKEQGDQLRGLLDAHRTELKGKALFGLVQKGFKNAHVLVLVAIADKTFLKRPDGAFLEAMKADQICTAIDVAIKEHREARSLTAKDKPDKPYLGWALDPPEMEKVTQFLLARDVSKRGGGAATASAPGARAAVPAPVPRPAAKPAPSGAAGGRVTKIDPLVCVKCGEAKRLEVVHRKDYCLLCSACEKYTALGRACGACSKTATIRKEGAAFYRACELDSGGCGAEVVFWKNAIG